MQRTVVTTLCLLTILGVFNTVSSTECPTYWTRFRKHCYRFFGTPMAWMQAELYCNQFGANEHSGEEAISHLVSINNQAENDFIYGLWTSTREISGNQALTWLGFHKPLGRNYFTWSDYSDVDFTNWDSGRPNDIGGEEDCVEMWEGDVDNHRLKSWNDRPCTHEASFICKMQLD